jgi:hypothetical protein
VITGCGTVFTLDNVEAPPRCDYQQPLPAGGDLDQDTQLNAVDTCPRVASQTTDDEDADGIPDACDTCPQLAGAGDDLDCDGLGAACDPDDAVPHDRTFVGFGSPQPLALYGAVTLVDSVARFETNAETYGYAFVSEPVAPDGDYETGIEITAADVTFTQTSLVFQDSAGIGELFRIEVYNDSELHWAVRVWTNGGDTYGMVNLPTGITPSSPHFTLRASIRGQTVDAQLLGDLTATLTAPLTITLPSTVRFGVHWYRDPGGAATYHSDATYLQRIVAR